MRGGSCWTRDLPRQRADELADHQTSTVAQAGCRGVVNGELLRRAEAAGFEALVTADRNMERQQTLAGRAFGVVVLSPRRLKMEFLTPLVPALREAVASVAPGEILHVHPPT